MALVLGDCGWKVEHSVLKVESFEVEVERERGKVETIG